MGAYMIIKWIYKNKNKIIKIFLQMSWFGFRKICLLHSLLTLKWRRGVGTATEIQKFCLEGSRIDFYPSHLHINATAHFSHSDSCCRHKCSFWYMNAPLAFTDLTVPVSTICRWPRRFMTWSNLFLCSGTDLNHMLSGPSEPGATQLGYKLSWLPSSFPAGSVFPSLFSFSIIFIKHLMSTV